MNNIPEKSLLKNSISSDNLISVLQSLPVGVIIYDFKNILFVNNSALKYLTTDKKLKKDISQLSYFDFFLPEYHKLVKANITLLLKGETPANLIFELKNKFNEIINIEVKTSIVNFNEQQVVQSTFNEVDSKINKPEEVGLDQKWINYKNLLDKSPIGIFIHDGCCLYCNKTAANILEVKDPKKLIGKNLVDFIIPEQRQRSLERIKIATKGEALNNLVYTIKTAKGKTIDVELKTVPFIYNGKPVVQTIISDVSTEKKLAKEKIRAELAEELNKKLKEEIKYRNKIQHELVTQTNKYEAFFNNTSNLIWTINRELKITSFNQNYYDYIFSIFNYKLKIGDHIKNVIVNKNTDLRIDFWIKKYNDFFNSKKDNKVEFFEIKNTSSNGKTYFREVFLHPIRSENGKITEIAIIGHDTTERRLYEQKIIEQSAKLEAIFESGEQLNWTVDRNYFFTSFNRNFSDAMFKLYKVRPTEKKLYNPHKSKIGIEFHNWWISKYDEAFKKGISLEFTTEQYNPDKKKLYRQIIIHPILKNGIVEELSCISNDITELRHLQNESINQAAKLTSIFESGDQLMWTVTKDLKLTSFNKNYSNAVFDLYGYYPEIGKSAKGDKSGNNQGLWDEKYALAFENKRVEFISERNTQTGKKVIRQIILYPIKDSNNNVLEISGIGFDITENKINEEKITQSLKEKEILLKEVHHRVKNNMQVISSILNLQSSYVKDAYALNLLKECQNRIKSMAFIHESLYQTKNFESVNFSEYVKVLTKNLVHTYSTNTKKIKLILTLDELFLNLDASIPCGLIINEIISNSLKYAFPDNRDGIIFVNLAVNKRIVKIEVGDNGVGISEKVDIKNTQTLGLQLVDTLIQQINGSLKLNRKKGTVFCIEFKK